MKTTTSKKASKIATRIEKGFEQAGSMGKVIINAKESELTVDLAKEAIKEVFRDGKIIGQIEIWTKKGIFKYP